MKTKKWLKVTLIVLLALVALGAAAGVGFRVGVMQSGNIAQRINARAQGANQLPNGKTVTIDPQAPNGWMMNPHGQGFDPRNNPGREFDQRGGPNRGFDRGRGEFGSPLFDLFHLIILGALLWFGYKYVKNSGWKLVREAKPAAVVSESVNAAEEENSEV